MSGRHWYTSALVVPRTAMRTAATLRAHRLGSFMPVFGVLLLLAAVLAMVNAIAPLAPFVYSLF